MTEYTASSRLLYMSHYYTMQIKDKCVVMIYVHIVVTKLGHQIDQYYSYIPDSIGFKWRLIEGAMAMREQDCRKYDEFIEEVSSEQRTLIEEAIDLNYESPEKFDKYMEKLSQTK